MAFEITKLPPRDEQPEGITRFKCTSGEQAVDVYSAEDGMTVSFEERRPGNSIGEDGSIEVDCALGNLPPEVQEAAAAIVGEAALKLQELFWQNGAAEA